MCHYKREPKKKKKKKQQKTKETKEQRKKNKRSKLLIPVLEEVIKILGMIFESHQ